MEREGGCCLAPRYGAAVGAGGQASMAWQMGRIMLKFRPIAPKSAAMAHAPTPALVAAVGAGRRKRKTGGGGGGGRRGRKPKKAATVYLRLALYLAPLPPRAADGYALFWPPPGLESLALGPDVNRVSSGDALLDLRLALRLAPLPPRAVDGCAPFFNDLLSRARTRDWFTDVVPSLARLLLQSYASLRRSGSPPPGAAAAVVGTSLLIAYLAH